jgi:hypothetical protein
VITRFLEYDNQHGSYGDEGGSYGTCWKRFMKLYLLLLFSLFSYLFHFFLPLFCSLMEEKIATIPMVSFFLFVHVEKKVVKKL